MTEVQTVRGAVDTAELGRTYMHEHVFVLTADVQQNYPEEWGDEDDAGRRRRRRSSPRWPPRACARSSTRPSSGSAATSRASSGSPSRCPTSTSSSPPAATPTTTCRSSSTTAGPALEPSVGSRCPTRWSTCSSATSTEGIAGTGVKAGMLKCAIDHQGMTGGVERVMRAVAKAHRQTGVPITVHTHPGSQTGPGGRSGCCDEEGVDPRPRRARPQRRHHRRRPPAASWPTPASCSAWTASASTSTPRSRRGPTPSSSCAGAATPSSMVLSPRRVLLHRLARPRRAWRCCRSGTTCTSSDDVLPYLREHGVTDEQIDDDARRQPAPVLRERRDATDAAAPLRRERGRARRRTASSATSTSPTRSWRCCATSVERDPDGEAVVELDGPRVTYRELWDAAARVAGGLRAAGVGRGDRVAIRLRQRRDWVLAFLGTLMAGGVAVPVNTRFTEPEVAYVVDDCGASVVLEPGRAAARTASRSSRTASSRTTSRRSSTRPARPGFPKGAMTTPRELPDQQRERPAGRRHAARATRRCATSSRCRCSTSPAATASCCRRCRAGRHAVDHAGVRGASGSCRPSPRSGSPCVTTVPAIFWLAINQPQLRRRRRQRRAVRHLRRGADRARRWCTRSSAASRRRGSATASA